MVAQAQNSVLAHAEEAQQERNVQRLIDAHTKDISVSTSMHRFALALVTVRVWHNNRGKKEDILVYHFLVKVQC